jgi:hypothetical protein
MAGFHAGVERLLQPADALTSIIKQYLRAHVLEVLGMAAIVTTMLYVPAAALLAGLCLLAGVSIAAFFTFGGAVHPVAGMIAWWAIFFVPVAVYSGFIVHAGGRDA